MIRRGGGKPGREGRAPRWLREVAVLYEDDAVVVLDKPAGLPAVPIPGSDKPSAFSVLAATLKLQGQRTFVVHRIDRFSSGGAAVRQNRSRPGQPRKAVSGAQAPAKVPGGGSGAGDARAKGRWCITSGARGMRQQVRTEADPEAARAELQYRVERVLRDASVVEISLVTGLQNQIRAQFAALGHPVIGDRKV